MFRILHPNEVFITEQVGGDNDRDLVEMVLPKTCKPFPHLNLEEQRQNFEDAGFEIVRAEGLDEEFGFVTEEMTEGKYEKIAKEFPGIIHMIRMEG